jgi:hypothetical protein
MAVGIPYCDQNSTSYVLIYTPLRLELNILSCYRLHGWMAESMVHGESLAMSKLMNRAAIWKKFVTGSVFFSRLNAMLTAAIMILYLQW